MRTIAVIYLFFIGLCGSIAQSVTVSKEMPLKSDLAYDLLGLVGDNILLYRDRGNHKYNVEVFDKEMAFVKERDIKFEKKKVDVHGIVARDSSFNMMYSYKQDGEIIHMIRKYDGDMILQDSTELFRLPKTFKKKRYLLETSENKKFSILFNFEGDTKMEFYLIRHDSLDIFYKKILEVKDLDLRDRFKKVILTDRSEILILLEKKNSRYSKSENHLGLFILDRGASYRYTQINNHERVVSDVDMAFDNVNRRVCVVGLWHDKHKDSAKGYFYLNKPFITLEEEEEMMLENFVPDFLAEANSKEIGKSAELKDFVLNQVTLRQDGGFIFFAESQRAYTRRTSYQSTYGRGEGLSGWMDHFFEDVVAIAVHPDGKEHWRRVLFKKQFSQDDSAIFSSYFLMKTPSRLKLVFNDEIKNNNTVSEYILDPIGRFNRNSLLSTDYQNLKIRFADAIQISSNEFIAPSEKNRKLSLVKIAY